MLILLDIDGVMVPANSWKRPEFLDDGFPSFSSKATNALQKIISETNADILLTTSHKTSYSLKEWKNIFKKRNISLHRISRLSENVNYSSRKQEIIDWFATKKDNKVFIIIDDDKSLNDLPSFLKNRLIQTSSSIGLTNELADEAIRRIEKETT